MEGCIACTWLPLLSVEKERVKLWEGPRNVGKQQHASPEAV